MPQVTTCSDFLRRTKHNRPKHLKLKRQELLLLGNEIAFNEAIMEERDQGIIDIQDQIGQANEIFKDLAVLVHEQGVVIDDIHSNIEASSAASTQARVQLSKASKTVKSKCSWGTKQMNERTHMLLLPLCPMVIRFPNRDSLLGPEIKPADAMSRTSGLDNYGVVGLQRQIMEACSWVSC